MHVAKDNFAGTLEKISAGLTSKELVAQSSCFIFVDNKVFTFNEEILCCAPSPLGPTFVGAVTAAPLRELLSRLPDNSFDVDSVINKETGKASQMQLRTKQRRSKVSMEADVVSPVMLVWAEAPKEWYPIDPEFSEAIGIVSHCASKDGKETDYKLHCVHVTHEFMETSDRHQVARYNLKTPICDILVRAESIEKVPMMKPTEIAETPSYLWFRNLEGMVFACRRFIDAYADLTPFIQVEGGLPVTLPEGLEEIVSRTDIFTAQNAVGNAVRIDIRAKQIQIHGEGAHGEHTERKDCTYDGEPLSFYIAPKMLLSISKKSLNCVLVPGRLVASGLKFFYCTQIVDPSALQTSDEQKVA